MFMDKKERFKVISGAHLLLMKENKILLLKRRSSFYNDSTYTLVSGHLDGNETLRAALCREANEEIGIKLEPNDLIPLHTVHEKDIGKEYITLFFSVKSWSGDPKNMEPEKCYELGWFDINNLPENTSILIKTIIPKILKGEIYSEFGW